MKRPTVPPKSPIKLSTSLTKRWTRPLALFSPFTGSYQLPSAQLRKLGLIYSTYRVVISFFLFLTLYGITVNINTIFQDVPSLLHRGALLFYCVISVALFVVYYFAKKFERRQLSIGLILDVIVLSVLLYSNGSADLQITMLYMVVVAASFMLLSPYQGLIITLLAIIFVIYQQFFQALVHSLTIDSMSDGLLLCLSFIGVGFISWAVSQRLAQVEYIAATHAQELEKLNAINEEVISKMSNGVLVIDKSLDVVISNKAAIDFLGIEPLSQPYQGSQVIDVDVNHFIANTLTVKHPELADWFKSASKFTQSQYIYELPDTSFNTDKLRLNTTPLQDGSLLVIIEDVRREQSNAQQLKLASLGQLTASIAHEIRNPIASISQASQLLIEDSEDLRGHRLEADKAAHQDGSPHHNEVIDADRYYATLEQNAELYHIIFNQTKRVNQIIEDVLRLSRQDKPTQQKIDLCQWLAQFVDNHFASHDIFIEAHCAPYIYFDPNQLEQVLINLINNGLRFSAKAHPHAFVELAVECGQNNVILDILDAGTGVKKEHIANLFNPFFTTDSEGTGLGLYLSQAFTQANHARLIYVPEHQKTCFRLLIPKAIPED